MADSSKKKMYYEDFELFMRKYTAELLKRFAQKKDIEGSAIVSGVTEDWIKSLFDEATVKEYEEGQND